MKKILVLGVGNILLQDEGVGIHVVRELERRYRFSENVTLLDGGTLGMRLLNTISNADCMVVADTLCTGKPAGSLSRLTKNQLKDRVAAKNSMHQVSFLETIAYAEFLGILPDTVLIGCEPQVLTPWGTNLSPVVASALDEMVHMVTVEIQRAGGVLLRAKENSPPNSL